VPSAMLVNDTVSTSTSRPWSAVHHDGLPAIAQTVTR
jgi:hypothetical protein